MIVVCSGDWHVNSKSGLCPPEVQLDNAGTYKASDSQKWMWDCWTEIWSKIDTISRNEKVIAINNGDLVDKNDKNRSSHYISENDADIIKIAKLVAEPMASVATHSIYMRGTNAHTGKSSSMEEILAMSMENAIKSPIGNYTWDHMRQKLEGIKFDVCHHVNGGGTPWTEKHSAMKMVEKGMWKYNVNMDVEAPDIMVRSHSHIYSDSGQNYKTFGVVLPAWQLMTEYSYRIGHENSISSIGLVYFICDRGKFEYHKYIPEPEGIKEVWADLL